MRFAQSSGEQTASAAIYAGSCALTGIHLIGDGTNDPKVILNDHATAASGTVKAEVSDDVSVSGQVTKYLSFSNPVIFQNGIYATVSGTGASYIIEYIPM